MSPATPQPNIRYLKDSQGTTTDVVIPIHIWQGLLQSFPTALEQAPEADIPPNHFLTWFQLILDFARQQSDPDLLKTVLTRLLDDEAIAELVEDVALSEAIAEGEQTETVPEAEVLALLDS